MLPPFFSFSRLRRFLFLDFSQTSETSSLLIHTDYLQRWKKRFFAANVTWSHTTSRIYRRSPQVYSFFSCALMHEQRYRDFFFFFFFPKKQLRVALEWKRYSLEERVTRMDVDVHGRRKWRDWTCLATFQSYKFGRNGRYRGNIPVEFVFSKQAIGYEGRNPPRERFRSAKRTDRGAIFKQRYLHDILCDWKNNGHTSEPE